MAGSKDTGHYYVSMYSNTIPKTNLLSMNAERNMVIYAIPYRYDDPSLNNVIYCTSQITYKTIIKYKGK